METVPFGKGELLVLADLISKYCVSYGDFLLASGKRSNYYLDLKKLTLSGFLCNICAGFDAVLERADIGVNDFNCIAGKETGANQLVGAYLIWHENLCYKHGGIVKRHPKDHGLSDKVIGSIEPGDKVVVLEDVATSGQSILDTVGALRAMTCQVLYAIAIVDRQEGASELLAKNNVPFSGVVSLSDLKITPPK